MKLYTLCIILLIVTLLLVQYSDEKKRKKGKHRYGKWKGGKGSGSRSGSRSGGKSSGGSGGHGHYSKGGYSGKSGSKQYSRETWIARSGEDSRGRPGGSAEGSRRYSNEGPKVSKEYGGRSGGRYGGRSGWRYGGRSGSKEHGLLPPDSREVCPDIHHYCEPKKRVWIIGVTRLATPVILVDSSGRLVGFGLDLVAAICHFAGETCRVVKVPPDYCSQFIDGYFFAGDPLMYSALDGCLHQQVIATRLDVVDYTIPYEDPITAMFHVRPADARHFHVARLNGKVIAYLKVSSADEDCILRNGIKGAVIVGYSSYQDAVRDVLTKKAFAFFSYRTTYAGLAAVSRYKAQCNQGWAVMARPGSELITWWNTAFSSLKTTPKYRSICLASRTKYGRSMQCSTSRTTVVQNSTVVQQQADAKPVRPNQRPRY